MSVEMSGMRSVYWASSYCVFLLRVRSVLVCVLAERPPRPSSFDMRSYFLRTRRIWLMSTPRCMSCTTICCCEVPASCSLIMNWNTCSSVIDDCAERHSGMKTAMSKSRIVFFIS